MRSTTCSFGQDFNGGLWRACGHLLGAGSNPPAHTPCVAVWACSRESGGDARRDACSSPHGTRACSPTHAVLRRSQARVFRSTADCGITHCALQRRPRRNAVGASVRAARVRTHTHTHPLCWRRVHRCGEHFSETVWFLSWVSRFSDAQHVC